MADLLRVTLQNGKYTVVHHEDGDIYALRDGEPWRHGIDDRLILALAYEVAELRERLGIKPEGIHPPD